MRFISTLTLAILPLSLVHAINLIPETPAKTPDYWCTWAAQNYIWGQGQAVMDNNQLYGREGLETGRPCVNEREIYKKYGWSSLFPKVKGDLIFLLDDGYYPGNDMAALKLDPLKYPSYVDPNPKNALERLNNDLKKAGWRGLGLWTRGVSTNDQVSLEKLGWSRDAGVIYWKIDTGDNDCKYASLAKRFAPDLVLENSFGISPFNKGSDNRVPTNYASSRLNLIKQMDVVRIYDRDQPLSLPTSIDRVSALLQIASGQSDAKAIINCEDEMYLGAALGCSVGIFRTPYVGLRPSGDMDIYMGGPKHPKQRIDEVTRAIRWHRLAPPFGANLEELEVDTNIISDSWKFSQGDSWDQGPNGNVIVQSAPARVSRGLPLPKVKAVGAVPWLLASRNPNGAVCVATLGRITPEKGYFIPKADVEIEIGEIPPALGIFGQYKSLVLIFKEPIPSGSKIFAQDLAGERAENISGEVAISKNRLAIPGPVIDRIGLSAATPGDLSDPGMVIKIN
jgi:hypothetical protein